MGSLTDSWWHRLFRVIQIILGIGVFIVLLIVTISEGNQSPTKIVFLLSSDDGYSNTLSTQYSNFCFGEKGIDSTGPATLSDECTRQMNDFIKSPFATRLVPNLDARDLGTIQNAIVAAQQMQQFCPNNYAYQKYFGKGSPEGSSALIRLLGYHKDGGSSSLNLSDVKEATGLAFNDPKVCDWFLSLDGQDSEYLNKINTITYKKILTDEGAPEAWRLFLVCLTISLPLLSILVLEIVYRLILFVAHGRQALRIKLK